MAFFLHRTGRFVAAFALSQLAFASYLHAEPGTAPPGPAPFIETQPLLPEMRALLDHRETTEKELAMGAKALENWLSRTDLSRLEKEDELLLPTAYWLHARLATRLKDKKADAYWEALAMSQGPFSDDARARLSKAAKARGQYMEAAHWAFTLSPTHPDFLELLDSLLPKLKHPEAAIEPLEATFLEGMGEKTRLSLVLSLAELHEKAGSKGRAEELLLQAYWLFPKVPKELEAALQAMGLFPSAPKRRFRDALHATRAEGQRRLKKNSPGRDPYDALAAIYLGRYESDGPKEGLIALRKLASKDREFQLSQVLTEGALLRRLDRDLEAGKLFEAAAKKDPEHPLSVLFRDQAAYLFRLHHKDARAIPLDEAQLQRAIPGSYQRAALWRLGFGFSKAALLAKGQARQREAKKALLFLKELEDRHGQEPDRHSISWGERARYWRGRAHELLGETELSRFHWSLLAHRFPAGWYALLARHALPHSEGGTREALRPATAHDALGWWVSKEDPIATAMALYRLGDEKRARELFLALYEQGALPGNARQLLVGLLELEGNRQKAKEVLKYASIPPSMPGMDDDVAYFDWYPIRFEEALADAARSNQLPSALMAGLVSVETKFSATARSRAGAIGAAQLLRSTALDVGKKIYGPGFQANDLDNPDVNLAIAGRYLRDLLRLYEGHTALAVTAYNAGIARVNAWLRQNPGLPLDAFVETIPYEEARRYVMRVLSDAEIYRRLYLLDREPIELPLTLSLSKR